jgi:hypothetical protein
MRFRNPNTGNYSHVQLLRKQIESFSRPADMKYAEESGLWMQLPGSSEGNEELRGQKLYY